LVHQKYSFSFSETIGESSWSLDFDVPMEEIAGSTAEDGEVIAATGTTEESPAERKIIRYL